MPFVPFGGGGTTPILPPPGGCVKGQGVRTALTQERYGPESANNVEAQPTPLLSEAGPLLDCLWLTAARTTGPT